MPLPTPFHSRTAACCTSQSWQEWSGYLAANSYQMEHIQEYIAVRTGSALFDVSPLYKYHLRGRDAARLLDRVVTRDVSKCRTGQVIYTAWCDDDGKIIDDGTLARVGEDFFRLTAAIPTLDWLQQNALAMQVEIEDVSPDYGALALQGPTSRALLQSLVEGDISDLGYFRIVDEKIAGVPLRISRTGFTGDLGYELFVEAEHAETLWDALLEHGLDYQMRPAGLQALDMARIEAGLVQLDADFTSTRQTIFDAQRNTPYELGLGWTVKLGKDFFVGQEALRAEKARGPALQTVGIVIDLAGMESAYSKFGMPLHLPYTSWNEATPIYSDGDRRNQVGKATSGTWSPILKQYVAMTRLKPQNAALGSRVYIEQSIEGKRFAVPAQVVAMPFFDPPRKRGDANTPNTPGNSGGSA